MLNVVKKDSKKSRKGHQNLSEEKSRIWQRTILKSLENEKQKLVGSRKGYYKMRNDNCKATESDFNF